MKCTHKIQNKKGFTMAELLIVVAIIAVLVAIAIPIINSKLEKSREAYDIATMRQAASAAIELYNAGIYDSTSAGKAGLSWDNGGGNPNAYGAYDPKSGKFYPTRKKLREETGVRYYGKGTAVDGGTTFVMGNTTGAYKADADYTKAVVMVSIYPKAAQPHAVVYWKTNTQDNKGDYIGGMPTGVQNHPKYYIQINLN